MNDLTTLYPGALRLRLGTPEAATPISLRTSAPAQDALNSWPCAVPCPLDVKAIRGGKTSRGFQVEVPLAPDEELFGMGLGFYRVPLRGTKRTLRVNADAVADAGDSHAPVPFYLSSRGYGVFVDTARYATFYLGSLSQPRHAPLSQAPLKAGEEIQQVALSTDGLYAPQHSRERPASVVVEVPLAEGVDVLVFWGDTMMEAVRRYNLFSGGGCVPPRWGLGVWYRVRADFDDNGVEELARQLRDEAMPCDVLGLEPGWQSRSYPCSFTWSAKFPDPQGMCARLGEQGFAVNLWTHLFTHPESPLFEPFQPLSGDYGGFWGLVPDLSLASARDLLAEQHSQEHVSCGVAGYKLDECDNSDFTGAWSFPELARFPSGLDGEQMHSLLGVLYQSTVEKVFERDGRRTYGSVRSSGALAAPHPFALYSDLYDHRAFVRALTTSGFCGLLWTPEVRDAQNTEDLVRRVQSTVFSSQALVNAWYIRHPPWKQTQTDLNNADTFSPDWREAQALCRFWFELRMQLVPYLHAAFVRYHDEGTPPFRALALDYPGDVQARRVDDAWLCGDSLLVAPLFLGQSEREVYLPGGDWFDWWSGERFAGGHTVRAGGGLDRIPLYVRDGAIIPLARPTLHTGDPRSRELSVRVYGNGSRARVLWNDDGSSGCLETPNRAGLRLTWDEASATGVAHPFGNTAFWPGEPFHTVREWQLVR